jgi:hypothetical protein
MSFKNREKFKAYFEMIKFFGAIYMFMSLIYLLAKFIKGV